MTLHERRAALWHEMEQLVSAAGERAWSADESTKYSNLETEFRSLTSQIDAEARFAQLAKPTGAPVVTSGSPPASEERAAAVAEAFDVFVRRGDGALTAEQRSLIAIEDRAMSTEIGSEGGYLVPETVAANVRETLLAYSGLRNVAEAISTDSGADILYPKNDDTANTGEIIAENTEVADQDLDFGAVRLGSYIFSSKAVRIPISLLQDSGINMEQFIPRKLGERIGRRQATAWIHGTGTGEPQGLVFGRDTAKDVNATAAVSFDNLQDLVRKVDPAYRIGGAAFVMNDTTAGFIRKIKTGISGDNTTLWQPSMQAGEPDRLLGYPVIIDQAMDDDAATGGGSHTTGVPVAFGNFRAGYIVRDVRGVAVARLDQTRARFYQIEFVGFLRSDGGPIDTAAYACIERVS